MVRIKGAFNLIHPSKSLWALQLDDHSASSLDTKKARKGMKDSFFFIHEIWRAKQKDKRRKIVREKFAGTKIEKGTAVHTASIQPLMSTTFEEKTVARFSRQQHEFRGS